MIDVWREQLQKNSGNFTTNSLMPEDIINTILEEDTSLKNLLSFEDSLFPELSEPLSNINGLNILSGLQRNTRRDGYLTLFRAIRFPTYKRIYDVVNNHGYTVANYEQERILELYRNEEYINKRKKIKNDPLFWTQPQERVVDGLPIFSLVNDALQIHRAYRANNDKVLMIAIHIPHELLESKTIKFIANTANDLDYTDDSMDYEIKDFVKENGTYKIDFDSLRTRGIDLHEMYTKDLPLNIKSANNIGILENYYLLDIYKIQDDSIFDKLDNNTKILKDNRDFLHGFFGDQNVFGRGKTTYLPNRCQKISLK